MNKNALKKIAYELNTELNGNTKAFIFAVCSQYLKIHNLEKENWLRSYLDFQAPLSNKMIKILEDYQKEFENIDAIGWLYQYFIAEEKERVFKNLMNGIKVEKKDIPYATQLFTPDWIVKYLVDNSLGRLIEVKKLEEIKLIDPCQGTGNILIYAFDVFYQSYITNGYSKDEAITNILTKNLYGIDIDETVCLITKLVLLLKAECFDAKVVEKMNIVCINDEYGSLTKINKNNGLGKEYEVLKKQYDVVCTNPPYMGKKNINKTLSEFLKQEYPDTKSEMYAAFMEKGLELTAPKGYLAMITIHSWMFISSFTKLREKLLENGTFITMLHSGAATFDDLSSFNALATSFVFQKEKLEIETEFIRLADYYNTQEKINNWNNPQNYYYLKQERFLEIPNAPFIYWISENIRNCFAQNKRLDEFYEARQGLATGDNKEFVRFWYEVPFEEIGLNYDSTETFLKSQKVYAPYNKGGIYRKWYGNLEYVIKFNEENYSKLLSQGNHLPSRKYYFQKGITWSLFGFENFGVRFKECGYVFDVSGSSMFPEENDLYYMIGYLCSNVCFKFLACLAPTVNFQVGNIASLPLKFTNDQKIRNEIDVLVKENVKLCQEEWSFYETNMEFKAHPFVQRQFQKENFEKTVQAFEQYYNKIRDQLRRNEEKLNQIYAKIFEVEEDVDYHVNDRDLTIKPFDKKEWIKSYLSYLVGVSVKRYDLNGNTNYSRCNYSLNLEEIIKSVKKILDQEKMQYIEGILKSSIEKFYLKEFIKYHEQMYQKHPIYTIQNLK